MKTNGKILVGLGAFAVLSFAVTSVVIAGGGRDYHRWGNDGGMMGRDYMRHRVERFAKHFDTNKDGKIEQSEIDAKRLEDFTEFDGDKDGNLSLEEFQKMWMKKQHRRMVRKFQKLDPSGDAKISLEEFQAPMANLVKRMDRNNDNVLSKDDMPKRMKRYGRSGRYDHNHDGEMHDHGKNQDKANKDQAPKESGEE